MPSFKALAAKRGIDMGAYLAPDSPAIDNAPRITGLDAVSGASPHFPLGQWRMGEDDPSAAAGANPTETSELHGRPSLTIHFSRHNVTSGKTCVKLFKYKPGFPSWLVLSYN
jgi:hypothetical protein